MKYGSVCSGIEAASVAWESLGWQAQWYSEIEHFPSAVLAHRFPTVPNLGDMTKLQENKIFNGNSIDLLVGGTPCTSFSVAGLRRGLDDPRGQLMLTFCELAARKRPKWVVWENVPGVLSSNKGEDLASFLGLLTGREIHPPVGGWKNSGIIEGIGSAYGVAWTVLDAQYFGVAQRRRRIFAIGYLGDWRPAAAVLFEYHRLSGDIKEGRKKRKATSSDAQGGVGGRGIPRVSGSLDTEYGGGKLTHQSVNNGHLVPAWWNGEQTAATLTKMNANGAQRMPDKDNFGAVLEPVAHAFKVRGGSETETGEQGGTPGKKAGKGYLGSDELAFTIGTTQDQQIAQPVPFRKARRAQSKDDHETWEHDEKTNTLNAFDTGDIRTTQAVVQPLAVDVYNQTINEHSVQTIRSDGNHTDRTGAVLQPQAIDFRNQNLSDDVTGTLQSKSSGGYSLNYQPGILQQNISPTITQCKGSRGGSSMEALDEIQAVYFAQGNVAPALTASNNPSRSPQSSEVTQQVEAVHKATMAIRRLTPTECERLQGFPDDKISCIFEVWLDPLNNYVNVAIKCRKKHVFAFDAEDVWKKEDASFAQKNLPKDRGGQERLAELNVLMSYEPRVANPHNVKKLLSNVLSVEQKNWFHQHIQTEGFARQIALISTILEKETRCGKEELLLNTMHFTDQQNGSILALLFGQGKEGFVKDAENIAQETIMFITSNQGQNFQNCDLKNPTWLYYALLVIGLFTQEKTTQKSSFSFSTQIGWTKIPYRNKPAEQCPDGPRYKACGNSMAVPVMAWIGRRIQMVEDILKQQNDVTATIPQL